MAQFSEIDLFRGILDNLNIAIYVVDREGKILYWNDGAERITGYLRQDVLGRLQTDNFLGETDAESNELTGVLAPTSIAMREGKPTQALVSMRHKAGHRVPVQLWAFAVRNSEGVIIGAAESFEESIALAEWDRRQTKLATYGCIDEASGVLNHNVTQSHIAENIRLFEEHHVPFSILCMELDHLDKIQARDGPGAIAAVLRVVGQTLENTIRPTDYLGRWQTNQFLAILNECSSNEIDRASERLRRMVQASKIGWWGDRVNVTISVGGTVVKHADTVEAMVLRAEHALRDSIVEGGNRTKVRYD